ncbi:hypothetical protein FQR65_LT03026 [Abscondita terminalis]|nr:hypothetical protein FQR65_LT03026 [Abscondita terminalis]
MGDCGDCGSCDCNCGDCNCDCGDCGDCDCCDCGDCDCCDCDCCDCDCCDCENCDCCKCSFAHHCIPIFDICNYSCGDCGTRKSNRNNEVVQNNGDAANCDGVIVNQPLPSITARPYEYQPDVPLMGVSENHLTSGNIGNAGPPPSYSEAIKTSSISVQIYSNMGWIWDWDDIWEVVLIVASIVGLIGVSALFYQKCKVKRRRNPVQSISTIQEIYVSAPQYNPNHQNNSSVGWNVINLDHSTQTGGANAGRLSALQQESEFLGYPYEKPPPYNPTL